MDPMDQPEPTTTHPVALMGFTSFEQQALESYVSLARNRSPSYALATAVEGARFIVANGDRPGVIDLLVTARRMGDTVLVGHHARQGAAAWLERPIDPLHLFRALDSAVRRREVSQGAIGGASNRTLHADLAAAWQAEAAQRMAHFVASGTRTEEFHALSRTEQQVIERSRLRAVPMRVPPGPGEPLLALIVDADDDAAMEMAKLLQSHGISSEQASDSRRAFAALQEQVFDLIVIESDLGPRSDFDGVVLTQAMKRQQRPYGEPCPPVFVTAAKASELEHAQASLAGASAYLPKPVTQQALAVALERAQLRVGLEDSLILSRSA